MDGGIWARMEQYQNELRKEFKLISNSGESSSYEHTYKLVRSLLLQISNNFSRHPSFSIFRLSSDFLGLFAPNFCSIPSNNPQPSACFLLTRTFYEKE